MTRSRDGTWRASLVLSSVASQAKLLPLLAILLASGIAIQLLVPQVLRLAIDSALSSAPVSALVGVALTYVALAVLGQASAVGTAFVSERVGWGATNHLRLFLTEHLLKLDLGFYQTHTPGELVERVDGDVLALSNFFSRFVLLVVANALTLLGVLALSYREDVLVGLAMTGFAVAGALLLARTRGLAVSHWQEARALSSRAFGLLSERLAGRDDIRVSGAATYVSGGLMWLMAKRMRFEQLGARISASVLSIPRGLFAAGNVVALLIGAYLYLGGQLTVGGVFMLFAYMSLIVGPLNQVSQQVEDLQRAAASLRRVNQLLATESRIKDGHASIGSGALDVVFDRVRLDFEGGAVALRDVSFRLPAGLVTAVVGRTGSGKTSLARLLARQYDPTIGTVRVGGLDLRDASLGSVRDRIAFVTQEVQMFTGTVMDNLTMFDPAISPDTVERALDSLGLMVWFAGLRDALQTEVGPVGSFLSAGEAQIVALARAILRDPGIVILDEPTSRLDVATESLIQRAIERLLEGRTGILIVHRVASLQHVDDVLVLESGLVVEHGSFENLVANSSSHFSELRRVALAGTGQ